MSDRRLPRARRGLPDAGFPIAADPRLRPRRSVLILLVGDGGLRAWLRRGEKIEVLGRLPGPSSGTGGGADLSRLLERLAGGRQRRSVTVVLRLEANAGLVREDLLPKRAARDLEQILVNRIDVLTPWSAEEVLFTCWNLRRRDGGRLAVSLAAARKARVEAGLAVVRRFGLTPDIVDFVVDAPTAPPRFDLMLPPPRSRLPGLLRATAATTLGLLALAGLWLGLELADLDRRLAARQERLEMVRRELASRIEALREEEGGPSAARLLARLGGERASPLRLLDALSRLLPDGVWLESLVLRERDLEIRGIAEDPAELVRLFESSPDFADPRFVAPAVRVAAEGREGPAEIRFALAVEVGGGLLAMHRSPASTAEEPER